MRRLLFGGTLGVFLGVLLLVSEVQAIVYVNAANDSGVEDGTITAPYNTIQEAVGKPGAGTISVAPGIYHGRLEFTNTVYLISEQGPEVTIIDGDGLGPVVRIKYGTTPASRISGFTIQNGPTLVSVRRPGNICYLDIDNCILTGFSYAAIESLQAAAVNVSRTLIYNPTINWKNNNAVAVWARQGSRWLHLENVTINNVRYAFSLYDSLIFLQNTTISNVDKIAYGLSDAVVNRISGNHNNIWNYQALGGAGYGYAIPNFYWVAPMNVDPLFVAPASGDYTLQLGSALIDAGIDVGLPFFGEAPDIGAYETPASIPELAAALAESYEEVPLDAYKNAADQRRDALDNKINALIRQIDGITEEMSAVERIAAFEQVRDKLMNDIWAKGDGFYGGNPNNDWITTQEEQAQLNEAVQSLRTAIDSQITRLQAPQ